MPKNEGPEAHPENFSCRNHILFQGWFRGRLRGEVKNSVLSAPSVVNFPYNPKRRLTCMPILNNFT